MCDGVASVFSAASWQTLRPAADRCRGDMRWRSTNTADLGYVARYGRFSVRGNHPDGVDNPCSVGAFPRRTIELRITLYSDLLVRCMLSSAFPASSEHPAAMSFRSTPAFTVATVGFAIFTDQFLFAVITPALPFIVKEQLQLPPQHVKFAISASLASFSIASMATLVFVALSGCPRAWRKWVYLAGLGILVAATVLFYTAAGLPMLLTARSLQGVSGSLVWVVGMGMLYDAVGPAALGVSMGTVGFLKVPAEPVTDPIPGVWYRDRGGSDRARHWWSSLPCSRHLRLVRSFHGRPARRPGLATAAQNGSFEAAAGETV